MCIAAKGLIYFASHDNNTIQLIEREGYRSIGLDNVQVIKMFEVIYFLYKSRNRRKKSS